MRYGYILLAVWLVLTGLRALSGFTFNGIDLILGILALAAGVMLLVGDNLRANGKTRARWKLSGGVGVLLLAIWLILTGLMALTSFAFPSQDLVMGLLALIAGLALAIGR